MKTSSKKVLISIERQYNSIKQLVPKANSWMADSGGIEKKLKKRFIFYSIQWDKLQSNESSIFQLKDLNPTQKENYREVVFGMMETLIQGKRITREAILAHKSLKVSLYEFMIRLRDQVMQGAPFEILPSFSANREINTSSVNKLSKIIAPEIYSLSQINHKITKSSLPESFKNLLSNTVNHTYEFSFVKREETENILEQIKISENLRNKARNQGKQFEVAAYNILIKMIMCQWELSNSIALLFDKKYDDICSKIQNGVYEK